MLWVLMLQLCVDGLRLRTAYLQRTKDRGAATQSASTASPERLEKLERHLPSMVIRLEQVLYSEAASQVCVLYCACAAMWCSVRETKGTDT